MKRREFLRNGSLVSLPFLLNGFQLSATTRSSIFSNIDGNNDKILVLINLNGGNDGLNTIIPLESYDKLAGLRQNVLIDESSLFKIDNNNAFHSAMEGMKSMYDNGRLGIVQGVAYPNQNRSHFRSTDIWQTGSDAETYLTRGWLGRYYDDNHPTYPDGYPNSDFPDPHAITMGYTVSETCQGTSSNFSLAVNDVDSIGVLPESVQGSLPDNCYGEELAFVIENIKQSNAFAEVITDAYDKGTNLANYPADRLAEQLKTIARLISGGLQTKVYVVTLGGFDTHANQVLAGNEELGDHANLLTSLSSSIAAFQDDIEQLGVSKRVLGMTYSEFGRRIRSNFSFGTDHGTAAPMFLFGECVVPGTLGDNPDIDGQEDFQAGVEMQYDFRSVYASVLIDWFGVEQNKVSELLFSEYQYLPIVNSCTVSTESPNYVEPLQLKVFPNPSNQYATIEFEVIPGNYVLSIFNSLGFEVKRVFSKYLGSGNHVTQIETHQFVSGQYIVRLAGDNGQKTIKLTVIH